jgi:hypothetical protein
MKIRYVRLERPNTESWMTFRLPHPINMDAMGHEEQDAMLEALLPGWEWVSAAIDNPDYEFDGVIPDFEPEERVIIPIPGEEP